ncbi:hypothetical protein [Undibacterium oligocarboniphilum]|uniref:Uncharacterized protein n=1 Tax=Undibacterium oligocarboniphilum TaxID=666702 RepID=A0A850QIB4_9BURK|nr:hypothetical protein [Undibacterium oligocarboniphilum]MBC3871320.1 hypothetical protein [Undibacterium oligocarboniphilum]NVO78817.1 hypothetical protein [Undibacterium oligocarboniphilum]
MSTHSHYLPLSKVTAGMILAENLLDKVGHILLPAGTVLTDSMLRSISNHHITQLCLEKEAPSAEDAEQLMEKRLLRLTKLFRKQSDGIEPANTLRRYVQVYRERGTS